MLYLNEGGTEQERQDAHGRELRKRQHLDAHSGPEGIY